MSSDVAPTPRSSASRSAGGYTAWLMLGVLLLFSIAAPLNQFKVPAVMPMLMQALSLSMSRAGWLMSIYTVTGLILALPAGFIVQKIGHRLTGLIAGGSVVLGAVLGAVSTDLSWLLVSRVVEGIGISFVAVLAPAVIARLFTADRRGVAMGIWSNWVPLGSLAMLLLAPQIAGSGNWHAVWWFGAVYALVVTGLFLVSIRNLARPAPPQANSAAPVAQPNGRADLSQVLRNRNLWLLGLTFAFFNMAYIGAITYLPTYLNVARDIPLTQAGPLVSLGSISAIVAAPFAGWWSDRLGSRKGPYLTGLVLIGLTLLLTIAVHGNALIGLILVQGLFANMVPANIFAAAVETVGDERLGGLAMGVIMIGQNAGQLAGPLVFGALVESAGGWSWAFGNLAVICLLAVIAGGAAKLRRR